MCVALRCVTVIAVTALVAGAPALGIAAPRAEFLRASSADLERPHDLKLSPDGKFLYVSDVDNDRIAVLDPDTLEEVGSFATGDPAGAHDIDIGQDGRAYVAEPRPGVVTVWDLDGAQGRLVGRISGGFDGPGGVLVHPNGRIYVAGGWSNNVVAIENGEVVAELDGLSMPHDLEVAPYGNIWLSDAGNNRMLLLSADLSVKQEWSGPAFGFNGVRYQDVLADGTVIAADKNTHRVLVIDPIGRVVLQLGTGQPGADTHQFDRPEGVEVSGETLWISDTGNNRVVKYRLTFD